MPANGPSPTEVLKVPELCRCRGVLAAAPHEQLFIIIHQVYELWFKLVAARVDSAVTHLAEDRVREATRCCAAWWRMQHLLISQVRILETMQPAGFPGFRYHLNPASGFRRCSSASWSSSSVEDPAVCGRLVCRAGGSRSAPAAGWPRPRSPMPSTTFCPAGFSREPAPATPRGERRARRVAAASTGADLRDPEATPTSPRSARCSSRWTSASRCGVPTT